MPWPLDTGAKLRNYHLARALAGNVTVTLAAFGDDTSNDRLAEVYQRLVTVPRSENYSVGNMLRGAIGRTPLPLLNYTTTEMAGALERLLAEDRFGLVSVVTEYRCVPNDPALSVLNLNRSGISGRQRCDVGLKRGLSKLPLRAISRPACPCS